MRKSALLYIENQSIIQDIEQLIPAFYVSKDNVLDLIKNVEIIQPDKVKKLIVVREILDDMVEFTGLIKHYSSDIEKGMHSFSKDEVMQQRINSLLQYYLETMQSYADNLLKVETLLGYVINKP